MIKMPIAGAALMLLAGATATDANAAAWCAYYDVSTRNCGFHTYQQCLATISGVGGYCSPNYGANGRRATSGQRVRGNRY
jgi:hypothetical protein